MKLEHLTNETFKEKVFNFEENKEWKYEGKAPAIIDFYADWCGPCKMIAPILEEIVGEYTGKLKVAKLNIDENPNTPQKFGIRSIPNVKLFRDGQPVDEFLGALPESAVREFLDRHGDRYTASDFFTYGHNGAAFFLHENPGAGP